MRVCLMIEGQEGVTWDDWVALATAGLALLSGVGGADGLGDLLVLLGAVAFSLQIALLERYAPRYDPLAFTFVEMLAACGGFVVVAVALGQVELPRGWTVWAAAFGFWLAGDRLGLPGWAGAALIMAGIVVAEPAAARTLRRLVRAPR